jgi:DNA replication and repair protein RecF
MQCRRIRLLDFRNAEEAEVRFSSGVNLLHGDNAQGKTNLLEALYYTALGKTFRTGHDEELIRFGADGATVENLYSSEGQADCTLRFRLVRGSRARAVDRNGVRVRSMSEIVGGFRVVLFCPAHLSVVQGSPEDRRDFLNVAISQLRPVYVRALKRFNRALKERNALLRQAQETGGRPDETIEQWSAQLAGACAEIAARRAEYILRLEDLMKECFADMTGNREVPGIGYVNSLGLPAREMLSAEATEPEYFRLLTERTAREIGAGSTLYGVHRDDLLLTLNGRPARLYASQGQQRSIALAMKLAEGTVSGQEAGGDLPVFLFDDVLSELDGSRRAYLLRELDGRQVIMTCCEDISRALSADSFRSVRVENGRYFEE